MLVMLFTTRVILGTTAFDAVPNALKPAVYKELKANGLEALAGDYQPPSA